MATFTGRAPKDTYGDIVQVANANDGIDATKRFLSDGKGTNSTLKVSSSGSAETSTLDVTGLVTATAGITTGSDIVSDTDSTDSLGSTGVRWLKVWTDDITMGGTLAGAVATFSSTLGVTGVTTATGGIITGGVIKSDTDGTDDLGLTGTRFRYAYVDDIAVTNGVVADNLDGILGANTPAAVSATTIGATGDITIAKGAGVTPLLNLQNSDGNGTLGQVNMGYTADPDHGNIKYTGDMTFQTGGNVTRLTLNATAATFAGEINMDGAGNGAAVAYLGTGRISSLGLMYSNGNTMMGYGVRPRGASNAFNSTYASSLGRTAIELGEDMFRIWAASSVTVGIGNQVTMTESVKSTLAEFAITGVLTTYGRPTASGENQIAASVASSWGTVMQNRNATSPYVLTCQTPNAATDNNSSELFRCEDNVTPRMRVYSDGDVWTADAGTLTSDETLKENIVDATSKLDELMQLRVVNFNWRSYEDGGLHAAGSDTQQRKRLGFIAQEAELVFPALVSEHVVSNSSAEVEVTKKGFKEAKLVPMLVKAMQEQQVIIQDLKDRVEALEA